MKAVFDSSPYPAGAARCVHLIYADIANAKHGYELTMPLAEVARRAGCSVRYVERIRADMVRRGLVRVLHPGGGRGNPSVYRFELDGSVDTVDNPVETPTQPSVFEEQKHRPVDRGLEPETPTTETPKHRPPERETPTTGASALLLNEKNEEEINEERCLCGLLQQRITEHSPTRARPPITKRWRTDMDLLIRRGPLHREDPDPMAPDKIRATIDLIFTKLAERSSSGFCWADQIRSPGNLRDKWDQMAVSYRSTLITPTRKSAIRKEAERIGGDGDLADAFREAKNSNGHGHYIDVEALPL
jgi:hypothetical protein